MTTKLTDEAVDTFLEKLGALSAETGIVIRGTDAFLPWLEPVTDAVRKPVAYCAWKMGKFPHHFVSVVLPTDHCDECNKLWHEGECAKEPKGG